MHLQHKKCENTLYMPLYSELMLKLLFYTPKVILFRVFTFVILQN